MTLTRNAESETQYKIYTQTKIGYQVIIETFDVVWLKHVYSGGKPRDITFIFLHNDARKYNNCDDEDNHDEDLEMNNRHDGAAPLVKTQYLHFRFRANYFLLFWKNSEDISRRSVLFHN